MKGEHTQRMQMNTARCIALAIAVCAAGAAQAAEWIVLGAAEGNSPDSWQGTSVDIRSATPEVRSQFLANAKGLRGLRAAGTSISSVELGLALDGSPGIESLDISACPELCDRDLTRVCRLARLTNLQVRDSFVLTSRHLLLLSEVGVIQRLDISTSFRGHGPGEDELMQVDPFVALAKCKDLTSLTCSGRLGFQDEAAIALARTGRLEELRASDLSTSEFSIRGLSALLSLKLRVLDVRRTRPLSDALQYDSLDSLRKLGDALTRCATLEAVGLDYWDILTSDTCSNLWLKKAKLRAVSIRGAHRLTNIALHWISQLPELEYLDIMNSDGVTRDGLLFLSKATRLRSLGIGSSERSGKLLATDGVALLGDCPSLKHLQLGLSAETINLADLPKLAKLEWLTLEGGDTPLREGWAGDLAKAESLRRVTLIKCQGITFNDIDRLIGVKGITRVEFLFCEGADIQRLRKLAQDNPAGKLRFLLHESESSETIR